MKNVKFNGLNCIAKFKSYNNGRPYITLVDVNDGTQVARCTVNIESRVNKKYAFIKDYSENKGIYDALIEANVIYPKSGSIELGFKTVLVCLLKACASCEDNINIKNLCTPCAKKILQDG